MILMDLEYLDPVPHELLRETRPGLLGLLV